MASRLSSRVASWCPGSCPGWRPGLRACVRSCAPPLGATAGVPVGVLVSRLFSWCPGSCFRLVSWSPCSCPGFCSILYSLLQYSLVFHSISQCLQYPIFITVFMGGLLTISRCCFSWPSENFAIFCVFLFCGLHRISRFSFFRGLLRISFFCFSERVMPTTRFLFLCKGVMPTTRSIIIIITVNVSCQPHIFCLFLKKKRRLPGEAGMT